MRKSLGELEPQTDWTAFDTLTEDEIERFAVEDSAETPEWKDDAS